MANYAEFSYGTGQTYGTAGALLSATLVRQNRLLVNYNAQVLIQEQVLDPANYLITTTDNLLVSAVPVVKVVPFLDGFDPEQDVNELFAAPTYTDFFEIVTGYHTQGIDYRVSAAVNDSFSIIGAGFVGTTYQEYTGRRSKTDLIVNNLPSTLTTEPGSLTNALIMAIGLEDDRIGGGYTTPPSNLEVTNGSSILSSDSSFT